VAENEIAHPKTEHQRLPQLFAYLLSKLGTTHLSEIHLHSIVVNDKNKSLLLARNMGPKSGWSLPESSRLPLESIVAFLGDEEPQAPFLNDQAHLTIISQRRQGLINHHDLIGGQEF
jgi:hypothetical protein